MTTEEPLFDVVIRGGSTDLAAVACWLTLSPGDWCIIGGAAVNSYTPTALYDDRLDVAADGELGLSLLSDLTAEGFTIQVDAHAQLVRLTRAGSGHRLQVTIHHGPAYRSMPSRADRRPILGQCLPVASLPDVVEGLLLTRADPAQGWHDQGKAELDLVRLASQHPDAVDNLLPADLHASTERDRQHALTYPDGDGWGESNQVAHGTRARV